MLIAIIIVALVVIAAVVAVPRLRGRSRPVRRVPVRRQEPVDRADETEIREARHLPREERVLIEEGQAIRAEVEARVADERPAAAANRAVGDRRTAEEIAWQVEQEQRERYPSTYGAPGPAQGEPGYVDGAPGYDGRPADYVDGGPGYVDGGPSYVEGGPGYVERPRGYAGRAPGDVERPDGYAGRAPGYVEPPDGYAGRVPGYVEQPGGYAGRAPGYGERPAGYVEGRDELAWQLERDRRERFPEDYPAAGRGAAGPIGGGLQPGLLPVSDALELQLQDAAVRSRQRVRPVGPRPATPRERRHARFAGSSRDAVEQDDERWT
jgi:hypothetical protein